MNIFVLCTGRCGSVTFAKACSHVTNYTAGHETRAKLTGSDRLKYPARHIEVDNRLSWFLGRLDDRFGDDAFYVHLWRDPVRVAESMNRRWHLRNGIIRGYADNICAAPVRDPLATCQDYVETVTANIRLFLKDKSRKFDFNLDDAPVAWPAFWREISAEGDFNAASSEFSVIHNAS